MFDARVGAFLAAHECLVAADKVIQEHQEVGYPVHALLVGRADVYARLATADQTVGTAAGQYLYDQSEAGKVARSEKRSALRDAIKRQKEKADDTTVDAGLHTAGGGDQDRVRQDSDPEQERDE